METTATRKGETVIPTPKWFIALRVFQIVFALVVVAMTGWWIHGLYYDELGFAIVCGLFTWVIALYAVLSEKVPSCRRAYNTWAVLALDLLMVIFWLAAMAATANRRSKFTVDVQASCYSDGSAIDSGNCVIYRRKVGVATDGALAVLSAIAGVSALVMLLFVATFAYVCHFFRLAYTAAGKNGSGDVEKNPGTPATTTTAVAATSAPGMELQNNAVGGQQGAAAQSQPLLYQQQQQYQYQQQPQGPEGAYPQQQYDPHQQYTQNPATPAYDPYAPQNTAYTGAAGVYPPQQQQQQVGQPQQYPYSPQGTPAPGQPYQVPNQ
ncbi:hypothetical protein F5X99DRAFT_362060 [Biscogniauxia marginata]|nr:hypothetical protein F5X99DRAFT_362060 [Biscogniauxia marginata]